MNASDRDIARRRGPTALARGFFYPIRASTLVLKTPALRRLAAAPILLTLVLMTLSIGVFFLWVGDLCRMILGSPDAWYQWAAYYALEAMLVIAFLMAALVVGVGLANVIAAPFNDFLSEKVEVLVGGRKDETRFSMRALIREGLRGVLHGVLFLV